MGQLGLQLSYPLLQGVDLVLQLAHLRLVPCACILVLLQLTPQGADLLLIDGDLLLVLGDLGLERS